MKFDQFVNAKFKREPSKPQEYLESFTVAHAAAGIAGEAGEVLDEIKKCIYTDKPMNVWKVVQELGDLEFYMSALRQELGITRGECLAACEYKLNLRHPDGTTGKHYKEELQ